MTKEEKAAEVAKAKKILADLGENPDPVDPKEAKMIDLVAKGVTKAIADAKSSGGKNPPSKPDKGALDSFLDFFGIET